MFNMNFDNDWIWTADLWYWKQPLYHLSHNHFPLSFKLSPPLLSLSLRRLSRLLHNCPRGRPPLSNKTLATKTFCSENFFTLPRKIDCRVSCLVCRRQKLTFKRWIPDFFNKKSESRDQPWNLKRYFCNYIFNGSFPVSYVAISTVYCNTCSV